MGIATAARNLMGNGAEGNAARLLEVEAGLVPARKAKAIAESAYQQASQEARSAGSNTRRAREEADRTPPGYRKTQLEEQAERIEARERDADAAAERAERAFTQAQEAYEALQAEREKLLAKAPTLKDVKAVIAKRDAAREEADKILARINDREAKAEELARAAPGVESLRAEVAELSAAEAMGEPVEGLADARKRLASVEKAVEKSDTERAQLELTLSGLRSRHAQAVGRMEQASALLPGIAERALYAIVEERFQEYERAAAAAREAFTPIVGLDEVLHALGRQQSVWRHDRFKPIAVKPQELREDGAARIRAELLKAGVDLGGVAHQ